MKKVIKWFKKSGFSNLGYVGGGVALLMFGHTNFAFALFGIAVYINWNVIRKVATEAVSSIPGGGTKPPK